MVKTELESANALLLNYGVQPPKRSIEINDVIIKENEKFTPSLDLSLFQQLALWKLAD